MTIKTRLYRVFIRDEIKRSLEAQLALTRDEQAARDTRFDALLDDRQEGEVPTTSCQLWFLLGRRLIASPISLELEQEPT
jgi:hypothetical protein